MSTILSELKEHKEDFEWYPTTDEIIKCMAKHIDGHSILDIGAGNGKVFKILNDFQKEKKESPFDCYAIEKSQILINQLPADVFVIGTDFYQQTFIDKKVDVVFCNPPYKEYEQWACKIIEQTNCGQIFLVIPERWKDNKPIMHAIKGRHWNYKTLGSFDFLNAERQARAKVNLIMLNKVDQFTSIYDTTKKPKTIDPFEYWFNSNFKITAKKDKFNDYNAEENEREKLKNEITKGESLIPRLEELYNRDMTHLLKNYKALENLDASILKELNVNLEGLKEGLKKRIEGLKNLYWQELFNNLDKITDRLTSKSRTEMLDILTRNTSVDFTSENAYAIVIWVIKNANKYFDKQLLEVYLRLVNQQNIKNYKSNKKLMNDGWRYEKEKHSHYSLDYRLVIYVGNCFGQHSFNSKDASDELKTLLDDIIIIGNNLGFEITDSSAFNRNYYRGYETTFLTYKNGNVHIKLNQKFMQAFNIEAGRLNGWLKDPQQASSELNIPIMETEKYFKTNFVLENKNIKLLEINLPTLGGGVSVRADTR